MTNRLSWPGLNDPNLPSNYLVMRSIHGLIQRLSNCLLLPTTRAFDDRFLARIELLEEWLQSWGPEAR